MILTTDYLDQLQADAAAILAACPGLSTAAHVIDDGGDTEARVNKMLAMSRDNGGKSGLAVIVLPPEVEVAEPNLPGPVMVAVQEIQILEHAKLNRETDKGTGIRSSTAAVLALRCLHLQTIGPCTWYADPKAISALPVKEGFVSHSVTLRVRAHVPTPAKPSQVTATWADSELSLACSTTGASIYYTTDGTYPRPGNGTLYTAAIPDLDAGTLVRAAAYKTDLNPGDCAEIIITA